jgi:NAD(P)-dependent dehydrogenase (short-subunit alcohol dehydrogenase family)
MDRVKGKAAIVMGSSGGLGKAHVFRDAMDDGRENDAAME